MKSNKCRIQSSGEGSKETLEEAARVAVYCGLDRKQTMQLRLMTEELIGMMRAIAFECSADLTIEEKDGEFCLRLVSNDTFDRETRKKLIETSTSHSNEATKGIMGKIRAAFEYGLTNDSGEMIFIPPAASPDFDAGGETANVMWSLTKYREDIADARRDHRDEWDELEKSIIANLADNVTVSASNDHTEIVATKRF